MSYTAFLWSLFVSSFISSTLFPGGSEAVLIGGVVGYQDRLWQIIWTATVGNTLGGMVTYLMGRLIPYKGTDTRLERFKKYGSVSLVFSWVPVVGDGFCLAAGWLKVNWLLALLFIFAGKFLRYCFIAITVKYGLNV